MKRAETSHLAERLGVDRRRFLEMSAGAVGSLLSGRVRFARSGLRAKVAEACRAKERDPRARTVSSYVDRRAAGERESGRELVSIVLRLAQVPVWDEASRGVWKLEVGGMVKTPLSLSLSDLAALPRIGYRLDHFCVEGWTAVATRTGVRLSELAKLAGSIARRRTSTSNPSTTAITRVGTSTVRCIHRRSWCTHRTVAT